MSRRRKGLLALAITFVFGLVGFASSGGLGALGMIGVVALTLIYSAIASSHGVYAESFRINSRWAAFVLVLIASSSSWRAGVK